MAEILTTPPEELTREPLRRIGEGIGRVVYASQHWVVKRARSSSEITALIVLWRILRRIERAIPLGIADRLMQKPSRQIRFLKIVIQAVMLIIPRTIWFTKRIVPVWRAYQRQTVRGTRLAESRLSGSDLIPQAVTFPPTRVRIRGWPGWLLVSEAEERAESTLLDRLDELAQAGFFPEVEDWLDRFLQVRQAGWRRGLFSVDAHLKNFGVIGERIVLLDTGGLTDRWSEIADKLRKEGSVVEPHVRLGLGTLLAARPDIAKRFNARWKATVNTDVVGSRMGRQPV